MKLQTPRLTSYSRPTGHVTTPLPWAPLHLTNMEQSEHSGYCPIGTLLLTHSRAEFTHWLYTRKGGGGKAMKILI